MPIAAHLEVDSVGYYFVAKGVNLCLDGASVGWGSLYYAKVASSHKRELKCAWNGSGRHRERVDIDFQLTELFFYGYAKLLFLIYNKESKVVPFYALSYQLMSAHENVDFSCFKIFQ